MTHDERVWELYKEFLTVDYDGKIFQPCSKHEKCAVNYYEMAEAYATAFERLSAEREGRIRTDSPFENRVPDFEVTAKEG